MVWPRRQCGHPILPRDGDNPAGNACPGVALPVSKRGRASSLRHKEGIFRARKRYLGGLRAGTRRLSRLSLPGEEVRSFLFTPPPLGLLLHWAETPGGMLCKSAQEIPGSTSPSAQRRSSCFPGPATFPGFRQGERVLPEAERSQVRSCARLPRPRPRPRPRLDTWFGPGLGRANPAGPTPADPVPWRLKTPGT